MFGIPDQGHVVRLTRTAAFACIAALLSGCASTRDYFTDRGRDAADVLTLTVGAGVGAKARVGPVHAGLGFFKDWAGLRGGEAAEIWSGSMDVVFPMLVPCGAPLEKYGPLKIFVMCFDMEILQVSPSAALRGKEFQAFSFIPFWVPVVAITANLGGNDDFSVAEGSLHAPADRASRDRIPKPWYYCTQIEAVAGLGGSVRVGFNPGELLDFILGWALLDIFDDDIARKGR